MQAIAATVDAHDNNIRKILFYHVSFLALIDFPMLLAAWRRKLRTNIRKPDLR